MRFSAPWYIYESTYLFLFCQDTCANLNFLWLNGKANIFQKISCQKQSPGGSPWEGAIKNFNKFTRKQLAGVSFLKKCFPVNFAKILKAGFYRTCPVGTSNCVFDCFERVFVYSKNSDFSICWTFIYRYLDTCFFWATPL